MEPQGAAEVPEIIIVSDAVEGTFVDLDGESRREVEVKLSRREREARGIRRNTGLCERSKEYGIRRRGREDLRTERGSLCFVVTISAARRPSATGSWLRSG